eukprot:scaffold36934_cov61-Phaeocystis_antarctica.AAC.4
MEQTDSQSSRLLGGAAWALGLLRPAQGGSMGPATSLNRAAARTRLAAATAGAACHEARSRRNTARARWGGRTPTTPAARAATSPVQEQSGASDVPRAALNTKALCRRCLGRDALRSSRSRAHTVVSHADPGPRRRQCYPLAGPGRRLDRPKCERADHSLGLAGRRFCPGRAALLRAPSTCDATVRGTYGTRVQRTYWSTLPGPSCPAPQVRRARVARTDSTEAPGRTCQHSLAPSASGCSKGSRHPPSSLFTGRLCAKGASSVPALASRRSRRPSHPRSGSLFAWRYWWAFLEGALGRKNTKPACST